MQFGESRNGLATHGIARFSFCGCHRDDQRHQTRIGGLANVPSGTPTATPKRRAPETLPCPPTAVQSGGLDLSERA